MGSITFYEYMLICLLITIIIEIFVSLIIGVRDKVDLINILLVNILTNPIVVSFSNLCSVKFGLTIGYVVLYILEIFAILVEGFIYKKYLEFRKIKPYLLSLLLNICSYLIGLIILRVLIN